METSKIVLLVALFLFFFYGTAPAGGPEPTIVLTKADDGKQITVPAGGVFEVRLDYSAGTGYSWEIVDLDKSLLNVLEINDASVKNDRGLVGGPMLRTWRIQAVAKGRTGLKIQLYRPWEGPQKATKTYQVSIQIK